MTAALHPPATVTETGTTGTGIPGPRRRRPERALRPAFSPDTGPGPTRAPRLRPPRDRRASADGSWEPGLSPLRDRPRPARGAWPTQAPTPRHAAAPTRLEQREWTGTAATAGLHIADIAARTPDAETASRTATHHRGPGRATRPLPPPDADTADARPATPTGAGDGQ